MDKKLKAKWIKALRSGKYKQVQEEYYVARKGYCCIGVLACVMTGKKGSAARDFASDAEKELPDAPTYRLIEMNDSGVSFKKIADYIEERL